MREKGGAAQQAKFRLERGRPGVLLARQLVSLKVGRNGVRWEVKNVSVISDASIAEESRKGVVLLHVG